MPESKYANLECANNTFLAKCSFPAFKNQINGGLIYYTLLDSDHIFESPPHG